MKIKLTARGRQLELLEKSIYRIHRFVESILLLIGNHSEFNGKENGISFHSFEYLWLNPRLLQVILPVGFVKLHFRPSLEGMYLTFSSSSISTVTNRFVELFLEELDTHSE